MGKEFPDTFSHVHIIHITNLHMPMNMCMYVYQYKYVYIPYNICTFISIIEIFSCVITSTFFIYFLKVIEHFMFKNSYAWIAISYTQLYTAVPTLGGILGQISISSQDQEPSSFPKQQIYVYLTNIINCLPGTPFCTCH